MNSYTITSKLKFIYNPDNENLKAILAHHKKVWVFGIANMNDLMKVIIVNWLWDKTTTVHGKTFQELEIGVIDEKDLHDFVIEYEPIVNQFDDKAEYDGTLFTVRGDNTEQMEYVLRRDDKFIWTLQEEGNDIVITNGIWNVNRLGYFVTAKQWAGERGSIQFVVKQ